MIPIIQTKFKRNWSEWERGVSENTLLICNLQVWTRGVINDTDYSVSHHVISFSNEITATTQLSGFNVPTHVKILKQNNMIKERSFKTNFVRLTPISACENFKNKHFWHDDLSFV